MSLPENSFRCSGSELLNLMLFTFLGFQLVLTLLLLFLISRLLKEINWIFCCYFVLSNRVHE